MKKSLRLICYILAFAFTFSFVSLAEEEDTFSLKDFTELQDDLFSYESLISYQAQCHEIAELARQNGYDESYYIIQNAKNQWYICENLKQQVYTEIDILVRHFEEYPEATYIHYYLTHILGYSEIVAAGIIGNIMVEVGGRTLNINYELYSPSRYYYGMCQWNKGVYSEIFDKGLQEQCNYLTDTIQYELDTYGGPYGYGYEAFLQINNVRDAAIIFAKFYERCATSTYGLRQNCAEVAYNYFMGDV